MNFRDFITVSTGNLWRMKLRTFLTVSGVIIAIAAFVSMLSFGAGNQAYVTNEYEQLGLFSVMLVYPRVDTGKPDTLPHPPLDLQAIDRLSHVPGVELVYPYDAFSVRAALGDSVVATKAQALPLAAVKTRLYSRLLSGAAFSEDSARSVLVTADLCTKLGITSPDSILGRPLVLTTRVSTIDSGMAHILVDNGETLVDRAKKIRIDSLIRSDYRRRVIKSELNAGVKRFMSGFLNAREEISDTLTICGVLESHEGGRSRRESIIVPVATARRFTTSGFSEDPADIFAAMSSGSLFETPGDTLGRSYPQVTLELDRHVLHKSIRDSVETLGFRTFSYAEQFEEVQRFFFYFDLGLGVIGLVALITASLGIINTMVMSILERKREIGVLKSLGADDRDIRYLFLAESGMIGFTGAVLGILFGWGISRVVSAIVKTFMAREGVPVIELFATPLWLVAIALGVGISVALLAGLYPARRAARVDPLEALRNE